MRKFLFLLFIGLSNSYAQSTKESLDYINTKQEVLKFKNNDGDIYQYAVNIKDTLGVKDIVVVQYAAIAGLIIRKDYFACNIKDISAVETSFDEIGRTQIKLFSQSPGFFKWDILNKKESFVSIIDITLSKNVDSAQLNSLIKAYKHLILINGGQDLKKEKF